MSKQWAAGQGMTGPVTIWLLGVKKLFALNIISRPVTASAQEGRIFSNFVRHMDCLPVPHLA
jgi:hypothetical protein